LGGVNQKFDCEVSWNAAPAYHCAAAQSIRQRELLHEAFA